MTMTMTICVILISYPNLKKVLTNDSKWALLASTLLYLSSYWTQYFVTFSSRWKMLLLKVTDCLGLMKMSVFCMTIPKTCFWVSMKNMRLCLYITWHSPYLYQSCPFYELGPFKFTTNKVSFLLKLSLISLIREPFLFHQAWLLTKFFVCYTQKIIFFRLC